MKGSCKKCGECCRWVAIIAEPLDKDSKLWSDYHGHKLIERDGKIVLFIPNVCSQLEGNLCKIHASKPTCCRLVPSPGLTMFQPPGCAYYEA